MTSRVRAPPSRCSGCRYPRRASSAAQANPAARPASYRSSSDGRALSANGGPGSVAATFGGRIARDSLWGGGLLPFQVIRINHLTISDGPATLTAVNGHSHVSVRFASESRSDNSERFMTNLVTGFEDRLHDCPPLA